MIMAYRYIPRGMPARFTEGMPDIVKRNVLDIIRIKPAAPLDFDICFREPVTKGGTQFEGLDFGENGARGCHFFLKAHEMRAYRERNRRKRVAWRDLPEAARKAIEKYCAEE
jgi:hypothetical protein